MLPGLETLDDNFRLLADGQCHDNSLNILAGQQFLQTSLAMVRSGFSGAGLEGFGIGKGLDGFL